LFFRDCDYTGIDLQLGPGVDIACRGHEYDAEPFDVVVSTECLEHDEFWPQTVANMVRLTKPCGLVVITCATIGRPEHGTHRCRPQDTPVSARGYYRKLTIEDLAPHMGLDDFSACAFEVNRQACDLYFAGFKAAAKRNKLTACCQLVADEMGPEIHQNPHRLLGR
jgi:hypothetical protein